MPNTSHYTRPGVAAASRLAALGSKSKAPLWEKVDRRYEEMLREKGGEKLVKLDGFCADLSERLRKESRSPEMSKDELLKVVEWKFAKGKPRYALINLLKSNDPKSVKKCAKAAFDESQNGNVKGAINSFCELKGVGPATASAILSLHRDDLFAFMDDEVIECLYEGKRGYTVKIYLEVNESCADLSKKLGDDWTPRRVGRALWTAARIAASGGEDLTQADTSAPSSKKANATETSTKTDGTKRTSKRRRKA